jgi:uncharacterized OsmC-like protein
MTQIETTTPAPRNGVNVPVLFATLDAVRGQKELARFQFRATSSWISGTHSKSTISSFYGAGQEHSHQKDFVFDGDHPAVLVGNDNGPTPVELLLVALAGCITAGIGNIAAARGIDLAEVESSVEGNIDLLGIFDMDKSVRNGYQDVKVQFRIKGNASKEELEGLVSRSVARSAVYDVMTNGIPVEVETIAEQV